jgi:hypothetical protein
MSLWIRFLSNQSSSIKILMRKIIVIILFVLIGLTNVEAQISNLANLANGEMQMFTPIFEENQDVYGYFTLFK